MNYQERLLRAIPGGAHTYSRGFDQYPSNAPQILKGGKGAYVYDDKGLELLDYGMALRAVSLGYAEDSVDEAAIEQIRNGNNLTRPSIVELEAAELLIDLIDSVDMVKFTKNGSTATTAAIKLSRAYTGRDLIARCNDHPFFSYDDWFIASTPVTKGIPNDTSAKTKSFNYNDIASLEALISTYPGQIACVILEPVTTAEPLDNFLHKVAELCRKEGIVFVLDEMITGFRWHLKGAQHYYNLAPDLCTFGKGMANGFSVAAVAGRREIMELGSIEFEGCERVFLLSTTHGAEMCGLGAFIATVEFIQRYGVIKHLWDYGRELIGMMNSLARDSGVESSFKSGGFACSPYYLTLDNKGENSLGLRTLFSQEMIKNGVLMPWVALSYRHGEREMARTRVAIQNAFVVYSKAFQDGYERYLDGKVIKPVFRKFN
jgi:glutamate-1-semialdehyde 2,1-aminomutase